jgi:hypothetical protein
MCRTKITVQSGAKRHQKDAEAAGRSALNGDLGLLKASDGSMTMLITGSINTPTGLRDLAV